MRIDMIAAMSLDGFITKGADPDTSSWTSAEDFAHLKATKAKYNLLVMGRKTFEIAKPRLSPGILRVVLTNSPLKFVDQEVTGQLEFKTLTPQAFKNAYSKEYTSALVMGGGRLYEDFLETDIVNNFDLTVEPVKHKTGTPLLASGQSIDDLDLPTPAITPLNDKGTTLRHYSFDN